MDAFTPMVPSKTTGTRPGSPERSGVPGLLGSVIQGVTNSESPIEI